jgi:hypothetical protein
MRLSEINIYPVKGLRGISLTERETTERGFRHDRRWMLIDKDGKFMTQREFPLMAAIGVEVLDGGLRFSFMGMKGGGLLAPFQPTGDGRMRVQIWNSVCDAALYEDAISYWFCNLLQTECRLVYMPEDSRRGINPLFARGDEIVSFADGYPFLVIGEGSLADLNSRLEMALPIDRFRPNLVVAGSEAFAEDSWQKVRIGAAVFRATKPCARCVVTTVDQALGVFSGKEPLKTLAGYRLAKDVFPDNFASLGMNPNDVLFGQNLVCETPGVMVRVGDEVEAL